eukprot:7637065-Prorocentrum_lima.AAC.1
MVKSERIQCCTEGSAMCVSSARASKQSQPGKTTHNNMGVSHLFCNNAGGWNSRLFKMFEICG